jgi:formylglycine-generating enzyme
VSFLPRLILVNTHKIRLKDAPRVDEPDPMTIGRPQYSKTMNLHFKADPASRRWGFSVGKMKFVTLVLGLICLPMSLTGGAGEPAPFKDFKQTLPGSTVAFEMVAIPGGEMTVGSSVSEAGRADTDLGPRKVKVEPFWMGRFEVTWQEYLPFVFADKTDFERERKDGITHPTKPFGSVYRDRGETGYPAIGMSQKSAVEFCKWLSFKTGRKYRLPTEAEWEYACRAGSSTPYFWGSEAEKAGEYAWFKGNSLGTTHPVGQKAPNRFGLHDIVGNVAEWCVKESPEAPCVVRGGAFTEPADHLRSAARLIETPAWNELDPQSTPSVWWLSAADFVGLRVVCTYDPAEQPR